MCGFNRNLDLTKISQIQIFKDNSALRHSFNGVLLEFPLAQALHTSITLVVGGISGEKCIS